MTNHIFDTTEPTNLNPAQPELSLADLAPDAEVAADEAAPEVLDNTVQFFEAEKPLEDATLLDDFAEAQAVVSDIGARLNAARGVVILKQALYDAGYAARYMERLGEKLTEEARKQDATLHMAETWAGIAEARAKVLELEAEFDSARRARDVALLAWKEVYNHPQSYQLEL